MTILLIDPATTTTGRGLLQDETMVLVLSPCCASEYEKDSTYACGNCGTLDTAIKGWRTRISLTENWTTGQPEFWVVWAKVLFGFENAEIIVSREEK